MESKDHKVDEALLMLSEYYRIPVYVLERVLNGYQGISCTATEAEAAAGQGTALRMALAGAALRALTEQRTNFNLEPYARDPITRRLSDSLEQYFGSGAWIHCPSATAATALAIRMFAGETPAAAFVEITGHPMNLEAGAVTEINSGRVTLIRVATDLYGEMRLDSLEEALLMHCPTESETSLGRDHFLNPSVLILSWPTTLGFEIPLERLHAFREICDRRQMKIVLDCVWAFHKHAENPDPDQHLRALMGIADAVTFSLPKIDCGPGAFVFLPRVDPNIACVRIRSVVKALGYAQFEAWLSSARWEAAWTSHRGLLWNSLRSHNNRATRLRSRLKEHGLIMQPNSAGNMVFFSAPMALSETLARRGATRWPMPTSQPNHSVHRIAVSSWYRPGWEDMLLDGIKI